MHQHAMYPANYNRTTPEGGGEAAFSPVGAFRTHTPHQHSPHNHYDTGKYAALAAQPLRHRVRFTKEVSCCRARVSLRKALNFSLLTDSFSNNNEFSKANNFKFCWSSNGRILIQKNEQSKAIHIKNEEVLDETLHQM
ncbi:Uncharacterized protein OBRU01_03315 [Operophtera brumata]|uniref:FP protein C-terminal domain-containing protein n=1 Tax=Operophtera brumata TaxID=104452 RepID=A0A0L7LRP8_OPEBR|nr:Uncharacterized protein OBRU01_03315 [Operophtera brumata]